MCVGRLRSGRHFSSGKTGKSVCEGTEAYAGSSQRYTDRVSVAGMWGQRGEAALCLPFGFQQWWRDGIHQTILDRIPDNGTLRVWSGRDRCTPFLAL